MKHDWHDPRPNTPDSGRMSHEFRKCRNCGKEQTLVISHLWMRIVGRRWEPLAGRCKPMIDPDLKALRPAGAS